LEAAGKLYLKAIRFAGSRPIKRFKFTCRIVYSDASLPLISLIPWRLCALSAVIVRS
jgi:hypothetical protein